MFTSLNWVPNAQVCVFDGTYYKITTTNYISKTSLYTTFQMYPSGPWPLKILMFALLVTREIATYNWPWEKTGDDFCRHLDLHLEVFVPKKKKEIVENITVGSNNLKTQNLRASGSVVSSNLHQRTSGFHERPKSFPGSYLICSKQRDHPRPYTHGLFDHHGYISKPDICFLIIMVINVMPGKGLVSFMIPASL
jgi:hypothetical protein